MANDRMFLRCPCGSEFMLAKHLASAWYTAHDGELEDRLDVWFEEHNTCDPGRFPAYPSLSFEDGNP